MKAVVIPEYNTITVQDVTLDAPKAGELKVKMAATGVCHSDLSVINGTIPAALPIVIGHEGAGIVEEVGPGGTHFKPGDHVVMSFVPNCKECYFCSRGQAYLCEKALALNMGKMLDGTSRVHLGGDDLNVMTGLGCMAEYAVVPAISAVRIDKSLPFDKAALVGCGVTTGVGAAINTAKVTPGSSVAVFGCGGVGLSIIQGARLAGAGTIIAVDVAPQKLEMASKFGATHTANGSSEDAVGKCKELTGGIGPDFTFEAVGIPDLMVQAYNAVRRGGTVTIVGVGKLTDNVPFKALLLSMDGKTVKGSYYGDTNFKADFPKLLGLYQCGKLNLDDMVTRTYTIDEAPQAFVEMEKGLNARGVIVYN
jgi:S-(hydroxymethyl)glutathione dehydrogenase/alcohol dehydrogenase